mmetsp:Transcript_18687/g.40103  ORF Transcript_18687/g.40103 Transcript_18687/m.40103 type:complete len:214 (+) Transcript_18687:485-1126(+)
MISFSSDTGRPSPGPQTFSRRAVQCSLERRLTAFSTTQSPGWVLFLLERKAGARTSSTTARARKLPTMALASGMSITRSSIESNSTSKPISISPSARGLGCRHASSRLVSSLSLGPASSPRLMALLTTSGWYSLHLISSMHLTTSSASLESKYSLTASDTLILNSDRVSMGPYTALSSPASYASGLAPERRDSAAASLELRMYEVGSASSSAT